MNHIFRLLVIHLGVTRISSEPLFRRRKYPLGCSLVVWDILIMILGYAYGFIKLQTVFNKLKLLSSFRLSSLAPSGHLLKKFSTLFPEG